MDKGQDRDAREHQSSRTPSRRRFIGSAIGAAAGVGLAGQIIPRVARAAIGTTDTSARVLNFHEIGIPAGLQQPIAQLTQLLHDEGHEIDPRAYEITYALRGSTRRCTRVWGASYGGGHNRAAIVATGGDSPQAAAFIQTATDKDIDGFRLFIGDTDRARETARLGIRGNEVTRIQVIDDAPHTVKQLEWLGRTVARPATEKKNCYCCMGCCYPSQGGGLACGLAIALGCGTGPVSAACAKDPRVQVGCVIACFALADVLCNETTTLSSCDSCSGYCVGQYIFKPRCCPGQTCGHAGCYDG